jgi:hypothetical protein
MINEKIDRRKKYYLILDCETATLPYASKFEEEQKKNIAIAKPLIYDLGWQVIDRNGKVYKRKSYLISEIFSVPQVFNTGYYAHKRPIYLERLRKGETILTDWNTAIEDLINDMQYVESVGAYNSMFDFKKAIPFTELYINMLYSSEFYEWEKMQNKLCDTIACGRFNKPTREFEPDIFRFRNNAYDLFDVWGLSCEHIMNNNEYKQMCIDNGWQTASGKYFKTSAETCFRYFSNEIEFEESHTAIDDTIIESQLFVEILRITKFNFEMGIIYFPFRTLGTVEDFELFGV